MARCVNKSFTLMLFLLMAVTFLSAQTAKTITVQFLDSKTGKPLAPTSYMVRGDHRTTIELDWAKINEDGTGALTVPATVSVVSIHGSYDSATEVYVNCDAEQDKDRIGSVWYSVSEIQTKGIVAPNGCAKPKDLAKIKIQEIKPGEIVFYVRKKKGTEKMD